MLHALQPDAPEQQAQAARAFTCAACGKEVRKVKSGSRKPVCSNACRRFIQFGERPEPSKALVGPLPKPQRNTAVPTVRVPSTRQGFTSGECFWCCAPFVQDLRTTGVPARFCSNRCSTRYHKAKRERRHGRFDISPRERAAIYERDGWTCQLCHEPVDPTLPRNHCWAASLDHIECQSWTLVPDHSPSNLRLAHRMCNSVRSDERFISPAA
jgi:endogenous inhibitor of DNA gyrase (YacG/DUF329 family)